MRVRIAAAAAAAMAVVYPAYADTNVTVRHFSEERVPHDPVVPDAFRIGDVANGRVVRTTITPARITLEIAGATYVGAQVAVPLALAAGTRVTGMTVKIAKETVRAEMLSASAGHREYFDRVRELVDPALLEHTVSTSTSEQLVLRVFPLTNTQHATVTLDLASSDELAGVDDAQSLFAAGNASAPGLRQPIHIACSFGDSESAAPFIGKASIRNAVKLAMPRLRYCYERELLHHHDLAGTANLHFSIGTDGKVASVGVDGDLDSDVAKQCIADDIKTWEFSAATGTTQVNYPLTFVVAGT